MTDTSRIVQDIISAAQLAEVPYDEQAIDSVIRVYQRGFETQPSELRTTTKPQAKRVVNFRYLQYDYEEDVLAIGVDAGLIQREDTPAQNIIAEAYKRYPVIGTGIDGGADFGLEKLWACLGIGEMSRFTQMESIPGSVAAYGDLYERYGLVKTNILGSDLRSDSMNIYFVTDAPEHRDPALWASLLDELGFTVPGERELAAIATTPSIALTYRWESPVIDRFCAYVACPTLDDVPGYLDPMIEPYISAAPTQGTTPPLSIIGYTYGERGDYTKIETDYSGNIGLAFENALTRVAVGAKV